HPLKEKPINEEDILDFDELSIKVEHMPGEVCDRCRITTEELIDLGDEGKLCHRCYNICEEHYPELIEES
ncbi:MAG: hypothetical protein L0L78_11150, partial [Tetragenococcus koreensis]|nr:hypothetical protein [Tetragenococcus koreensis]